MPAYEAEQLMLQSGMRPPLIVKPVWTDGREGSHGLAVVHDMVSLINLLKGSVQSSVKPPAVIQEFVEHGGVLFKVMIGGPLSHMILAIRETRFL
jgi:inositol-1,3,4-trisphosphate 5/6-kinase/inositol-tetrakisphosphate 1-kinase